jgi:hypothetical protein
VRGLGPTGLPRLARLLELCYGHIITGGARPRCPQPHHAFAPEATAADGDRRRFALISARPSDGSASSRLISVRR